MLASEVWFKTSRSSGKGGQNVNKVSSKVELNFDVPGSKLLTEPEKQMIRQKLASRINQDGILKVVAESSRSQLENKAIAVKKFEALIREALRPVKKRIPTRVSRTSVEKRITAKKRQSDKKLSRRKPEW